MSGKLGDGVLPHVLRDIYARGKSGFLGFSREDESCGLHFLRGHILCGEASPTGLRVGEVMVSRGLLEREVLNRALEARDRGAKRLGEILQEQGVLDAEEVEYALSLQVQVILARVFSWKGGAYVFDEASGGGASGPPRVDSTGAMILGAVRLVRDREAVGHALGSLERTLLPATDPLLRFQKVTLSASEGFVLSRVDGASSAREVLQVTPLPPAEAERSLLGLVATGMVEFASPAPRESAWDSVEALRREILEAYDARHRRSDAEVLRISPKAPPAEVRAAYMRLAKRYHPDAHHHPALADLHEQLRAVFFRLSSAYEALTRAEESPAPVTAPEGAPARTKPEEPRGASIPATPVPEEPHEAQDLVGKAEERFGDGKYWEAVALLEEAIPRAQGPLRAKARLLLARIDLKYPDRLKHAERELLAVLQETPDSVEGHFLLGTLYKQGGLAARAAAMFRRALELNPRHKSARRELADVTSTPAPDEGVLKKLFGKR